MEFLKTFLDLYGSILEQPLTIPVNSYIAKIMISFWLLSMFVISRGYSTTLLSFLTVPYQPQPIGTFEELSAFVKKGKYKCFVQKGTVWCHCCTRLSRNILEL
ncbi:putative glutamate receptor [Caerostris extrusa]|uniref:Glutamate receptor n=1 Tax=Caerostris extrusa TaxID=172846 RepID=A0AAV4PFZ6_CAEEX|nr:putative glutamate receptor [Caerostris extrusa]